MDPEINSESLYVCNVVNLDKARLLFCVCFLMVALIDNFIFTLPNKKSYSCFEKGFDLNKNFCYPSKGLI